MPRIRQVIATGQNVIFESNSLMRFLRPDLYLSVLDFATADFKDSAREYLDRADALIVRNAGSHAEWQGVSLKPVARKPVFHISPPPYVTEEIVDFVCSRLTAGVLRAE